MRSMDKEQILQKFFPAWEKLSREEQEELIVNAESIKYQKGEVIHRGNQDCRGLMIVKKGQLRAYIVSEEGREVTLFRVKENEVCVLSASCLMDSLAFEVLIDAVIDMEVLMIPAHLFSKIMKEHMEVELYLYKTSAERFSDVVWLMQQILFFGADKRVAGFLWDEMTYSRKSEIYYTHEEIAKLIGSAREVVTKVLKYLAEEGVVTLGRGKIMIVDKEKLKKYL